MNCKQGDLAVFIRSYAGNEGKMVTCVRYVGIRKFRCPDGSINESHGWEIDRDLVKWNGKVSRIANDDNLRPIRGGEGMDEMLRITGKPKERHNA